MKTKCLQCDGSGIDGRYICLNCYGYGEVIWTKNLIQDNNRIYSKAFIFYEEIRNFKLEIYKKYSDSPQQNYKKEILNQVRLFMNEMKEKYKFYNFHLNLTPTTHGDYALVITILPTPFVVCFM